MVSVSDQQEMILVVEDNQKINRMFCKQLEASGFRCVGVSSVREALEYIQQYGEPQVMILDLELEDGVGTQVLDYLVQNDLDNVRVVVVSANAYSKEHNIKAYKTDHILLKPVSPRGLSALVKDFFK